MTDRAGAVWVGCLAGLLACGGDGAAVSDAGSSGSSVGTAMSDTTAGPTGSATGDDGTGSDEDTNGGGREYCEEAGPPGGRSGFDVPWPDECSMYTQTCPAGQKCALWKGVAACTPLDPDPALPGETCMRVACGDECDETSLCYLGVCAPFCSGTEAAPVCGGDSICVGIASTVGSFASVPVCVPTCDPLGMDCPDPGICTLSSLAPGFACLPPGTAVADPGGPCGLVGEGNPICPTGQHCVDRAGGRTCQDLCSTDDAQPCVDPGQLCEPLEDPALVGLGICS